MEKTIYRCDLKVLGTLNVSEARDQIELQIEELMKIIKQQNEANTIITIIKQSQIESKTFVGLAVTIEIEVLDL